MPNSDTVRMDVRRSAKKGKRREEDVISARRITDAALEVSLASQGVELLVCWAAWRSGLEKLPL